MSRLGISLGLIALLLTACTPQSQTSSAHLEEPYAPSTDSPYGSDPAYTSTGGSYAEPADPGYASLDSMERAPAPVQPATLDNSAYAASEDEMLTPSSGRTYVVAKGDTFFKLARQFYRNQSRWRDIWSANKSRVPNPDILPIGTKLIIP